MIIFVLVSPQSANLHVSLTALGWWPAVCEPYPRPAYHQPGTSLQYPGGMLSYSGVGLERTSRLRLNVHAYVKVTHCEMTQRSPLPLPRRPPAQAGSPGTDREALPPGGVRLGLLQAGTLSTPPGGGRRGVRV